MQRLNYGVVVLARQLLILTQWWRDFNPIGWRKNNNRADHPIFYLDTLMKTGSESIAATLRRRRILFAGFVARMEDTRLPECA